MYQKKYAKYKTKYLALTRQSLLFDYTDQNSTLKFIQSILPAKPSDKPYVLILYGPPGSGKTFAKDLICGELNLDNNYVYFSEDYFAYHTVQFQELKKSVTDTLTQEELQAKYNVIKKATSYIIYMLLGITMMYKYNAVVEMTGNGLGWYMTHVIDEFAHYKYGIHLVYPYIDDVNILIQRVEQRARVEFRSTPEQYVRTVFVRAKDNFIKLIESGTISKFDNIYVYNANGSNNLLDNLIYQYSNHTVLMDNFK
jgi:hypothetical protein